MKRPAISEEARAAILRATWSLIAKKQRLDVSQSEIAAAAKVSRQTVYLAFGDRAGLLTAMAQNKDAETEHVAQLTALSRAAKVSREDFLRYLGVWLDYLPVIYPVGILLDASSLTDESARAAWDDRMKNALLAGLKRMLRQLGKNGELARGLDADRAAELAWSLVHPTSWRQLVIDCGWSKEDFSRSRLEIVERVLLTGKTSKARKKSAR
jgi:AcrR family transcriptional regulator